MLAVIGVFKANQDSAASQDDDSSAPGRPKAQRQDTAHISWGPIGSMKEVDVSPDGPDGALGIPAAAFDPVVGTVALWPNGGNVEVRIKPPGEPWGRPHLIFDAQTAESVAAPMVATDGAGTITAAWVQTVGARRYELMTATRASRGKWTEPTMLWRSTWFDNAEEPPVLDPHLAVGSDGSAALAWTEQSLDDPRDEDSTFTQAHAVYRPARGPWQRETMLGRRKADRRNIGNEVGDVGIDGQGVATVLVADSRGTRAFRDEGENWAEAEFIDKGSATDMVVAPDGTTSIVLIAHHDSWNEVRAMSRENGVWTAPERLAPPSQPRASKDFVYHDNPQLTVRSGTTTVALSSWNGPVQEF